MDTLHINTPADLVSLIGHSLGYGPTRAWSASHSNKTGWAQPSDWT